MKSINYDDYGELDLIPLESAGGWEIQTPFCVVGKRSLERIGLLIPALGRKRQAYIYRSEARPSQILKNRKKDRGGKAPCTFSSQWEACSYPSSGLPQLPAWVLFLREVSPSWTFDFATSWMKSFPLMSQYCKIFDTRVGPSRLDRKMYTLL